VRVCMCVCVRVHVWPLLQRLHVRNGYLYVGQEDRPTQRDHVCVCMHVCVSVRVHVCAYVHVCSLRGDRIWFEAKAEYS